jgi:serine/threonine-protein kinase
MLAELEVARLDHGVKSMGGAVNLDRAPSDLQFARAFREHGIDVEALELEAAAALVRGSAIREHLVAALDYWRAVKSFAGEGHSENAKRLLAITRQVDPDPWRNRLRELVLGGEVRDWEQLAQSAPPEELPAVTLEMLGAKVVNEVKGPGPILTLLRRAQRRFPADFWINQQLAYALHYKVQPARLEESIGFYRAAVALRPQSPGARFNLALCLDDRDDQGRDDKGAAIAEYQEAIRLKPGWVAPYVNLGIVLMGAGKLDEALACCEEAIRLQPNEALAHLNLGLVLQNKGNLDGAIASYEHATRLRPDLARAYGGLGEALLGRGRFAEARTATRRGLELLPEHAPLRQYFSQQLQQCERLAELDGKLPAFLGGKEQPASATQWAGYTQVCLIKHLYVAASRLFREAIMAHPDLVASPANGVRYNAACAAALAGCGEGKDAADLTAMQRLHWRRQALTWLHADLRAWQVLLAREPGKARAAVAKQMQHWLADSDFNGVRGAEALDRLAAEERAGWRKLWADVAATLARAQETATPEQKGAAKTPRKD